jgi:hypothetical protein
MNAAHAIKQFARSLKQIDTWLDKAAVLATEKGFDVEILAAARLAPDQFALLRQIQAACDAAKFAAAYLAGQAPPSHPDTETSIPQIRSRIHTVVAYLEGFSESDFADADARWVSPGWARGKRVAAADYLHEVAAPNFYFHASMAYAILRHNGVPLGKGDFLGPVSLKD